MHDQELNNSQLMITDEVVQRARECLERSPELAGSMASMEDIEFVRGANRSAIELLAAACERYADRPCLGNREFTAGAGGLTDGLAAYGKSFKTVSYAGLWNRINAFARGAMKVGLLKEGSLLGICAPPGVNWVVAGLACMVSGTVKVPFHLGMPNANFQHMIFETELSVIVCSAGQAAVLGEVLPFCPSVLTIIVMRESAEDFAVSADDAVAAIARTHQVVNMEFIEREGHGVASTLPVPRPDSQSLDTIMYSSGSTGKPKGVMVPEGRWRLFLLGALQWRRIPQVVLGNLPLSHHGGWRIVLENFMHGGATYFTADHRLSSFFEDAELIRPTHAVLLPRISASIYQQFQSEVIRRTGAATVSVEAMDTPIGREIMEEMGRTVLGDRLCWLRSGSAAVSPEVETFVQRCFDVWFTNGYGSTEAGQISLNGEVNREHTYKLIDVPELGYFVEDEPYPRGELLVKTPSVALGYYNNPAATAALFDGAGYLRVGDIVEERGPGQLAWVDRRNNVIKLSNGEFVGISRLENLYGASPLIKDIYLHGDSDRAYLVGVIVPVSDATQELSASRDVQQDIRNQLRQEMQQVALREGLRFHEVPRDFLVEKNPFTVQNELLIGPGKPNRPRLRQRYRDDFNALYTGIEARQFAGLERLANDTSKTVRERVSIVLAMALGLTQEDLNFESSDMTFIGCGGDSLGAVRFSSLLEEALAVSVPPGVVLDRAKPLRVLVDWIEEQATSGHRSKYDEIHAGVDVIEAASLTLERFMLIPEPKHKARDAVKKVLLTGANGFLGRFTLLNLLARLAGDDEGEIICLVRASSPKAAMERLRSGMAGGNGQLLTDFDALTKETRITMLAGDLTSPRFGLDEAIYRQLQERVDSVIHNGALVNHAFSYRHLFEPNVLGTVEMIRFASELRPIPITFVSTLGVGAPRSGNTTATPETAFAAELWPTRPVEQVPGEHATGYVTSKWVGEILLREIHQRCGLGINIARCGMILPHGGYFSSVNESDNINRLLFGLVETRMAPESFYAGEGTEYPIYYDGVPVDSVASFLADLALTPSNTFETYHVTSCGMHPPVSLDQIVDWIEASGVELQRMPHSEWIDRFRNAVQDLPADRRARSPLPVLARWEKPIPSDRIPQVEGTRFQSRLDKLRLMRSPALTAKYVRHWVRSLG